MKDIPKTRLDRMGRFNNALVGLIDQSGLPPTEVVMVLRLMVRKIEQGFELSVRKREK